MNKKRQEKTRRNDGLNLQPQPIIKTMAKTIGLLLETAHNGVNLFENHISEVLDKQMLNRLLSQYDKLVKAGLTHQEALDTVTNLINRRLETAIQERSQNDN